MMAIPANDKALNSCIDRCTTVADQCQRCIEEADTAAHDMDPFRDAITVASATATLLERRSPHAAEMAEICQVVCEECLEMCRQSDLTFRQHCLQALDACVEACEFCSESLQ